MNVKWSNNKDANKQQLLNLVLQLIAGEHASPVEGLIHYDSTAHRARVHNGSALKAIAWADEVAGLATQAYVNDAIAALVDAAPGTLDTLNELAAALADDPNFAATINAALGQRYRKFSAVVGNGVLTSIPVTHNFGTLDVLVQCYEVATGGAIEPDVDRTNINVVTLGFNPAPATNSVGVVIGG